MPQVLPANDAPCPETKTAALELQLRHGGHDERACGATFKDNGSARHRFASSLILRPIWSDEHVFAGWQTDGEAAALLKGGAR
jgi:hypothetical protein